jgi:hypothetical protein
MSSDEISKTNNYCFISKGQANRSKTFYSLALVYV